MCKYRRGDRVIISASTKYLRELYNSNGCRVKYNEVRVDETIYVHATVIDVEREMENTVYIKTDKSNWIPTNIVSKLTIVLGGERDE